MNQPGPERRQRLNDRQRQRGHAVHVGQQAEELPEADCSVQEAAEHFGRVPEGHIPLALSPAHSLTDGRPQIRGLFVIDPGVVVPQNPSAFQRRLDLDFKILRQGHGGPSAPLVQIGRRHGESGPADRAVQPEPVLGQIKEAVGQRIARVVEPGHHAFLVLRAQIALNEIRLALVQILAVHLAEHVAVHQVVRVKDHHQIVPVLIIAQRIQRLAQRNGLPGRRVRRFLPGLNHPGAGRPGHLRRTVRAVVRDDVIVVQFSRIIHLLEIADDIPNHPLLVVRGNQHQKAGLGIMIRIILRLLSEAEQPDTDLIEHGYHQQQPREARNGLQNHPKRLHPE